MSKSLINQAEKYCKEHKLRLTDSRLDVLKIIAACSKPIGAYDILERLKKTIKNPKPPTVYRAIEFWESHDFIHRIESLNAYVVCDAGHHHKGGQFLICDDCGKVIEAHLCELPKPLKESAIKNTFTPFRWNLEIHGRCKQCTL